MRGNLSLHRRKRLRYWCNKLRLWEITVYKPDLSPFNNSRLTFLRFSFELTLSFSFALGDTARFFRWIKWLLWEYKILTSFTTLQFCFLVVFLHAERYSYFFGCCKWMPHWRTKYRPDLRLFNNSSFAFVTDDVNFALKPDAGLAEWDLGVIELVGSKQEGEAGL